MQNQAAYEQRLCAFVDILGFRGLVQDSMDHPALQDQIRQILREVVSARPIWERDPPVEMIAARLDQEGAADPKREAQELVENYGSRERGTTFSDSLVLSATLDDHAIAGLVTSLLFVSRDLAEIGFYVRGGVCLGPLCHEADMCFGPAFVAAYDLERGVAFYPRIVFSPEAHATVSGVEPRSVGPLAHYLREDFDGEVFLHFLSPAALDLCGSFRAEQMCEIRRQLGRQLSSSQARPRVRQKLIWLARHFNCVLEEAPVTGVSPLPGPA